VPQAMSSENATREYYIDGRASLQELTAASLSANPAAKQPLDMSNWSDYLAAHA
jgi:hypothetical protein